MKKNYYLIGSALGLVTTLVMFIIIFGSFTLRMLTVSERYNGILSISVGIAVALGLGYFFDRKSVPTTSVNQVFVIPVFIFMVASLAGCLANYFLNGYPNFFFDYFTRPIWALGLFGFPTCLVVSLAWQFANTQHDKRLTK